MRGPGGLRKVVAGARGGGWTATVAAAALCLMLLALPAAAQDTITLTDVAGRTVTIPRAPKRILLAQGRHFPALTLIHPEAASLIVGFGGDFKRETATFALYLKRYPRLGELPVIGQGSPATFSIEAALATMPDLVITSAYLGGESPASTEQIRQFEAAGVPVVVVDFFVHPLRDTVPSLRILGQVLGREAQAQALISFWEQRRRRIDERVGRLERRPTVFMHVHAGGSDCCYSPGRGTFDAFITAAGGHNIGADVLPGTTGQLNAEYILSRQPDAYIATGGSHLAARGGFVLGPGVTAEAAAASFRATIAQPPVASLGAVARGRALGLWHHFNDTPVNIVAVEAIAKWLHPQAFADVDPAASLAEINARFAQVPFGGTFWVSLPAPR
ncbi:ABC transporter substrate-binding protein [Chelatococcus reniformis]|uniref:Ferrichrome ABC transporter substrate-binding protein n=1 Tax=Chelatococcus reniformis TaxID=1494448 RepID=A0A916UHA6_9HYPH|nr:ABC transporter substrate-binding protein [Chelatococcus reniformis]GGC71870.1 ferrichrome ABC transporter substrate-binding protein [Chelatococcus reniformis]